VGLSRPPTPEQSMRFALIETDTLIFIGFHAAVFVAVVVVLLAVQRLFDRDGRR
jgi:hypothetical protein